MEFTREDHDRISDISSTVQSLAVSVEALDRLVVETRNSDRRALEIADGAQKEALQIARSEMDARMEKVNEFRGALSDAQQNMMPRAEVALLIGNLTLRLDEIGTAQTALLGQVIEMRSSGIGRATGTEQSQVDRERNRVLVFGLIASVLAVAGFALAFVSYVSR